MPWWDKMAGFPFGNGGGGGGDVGPLRIDQPVPQRNGVLIEGHSPGCDCQCDIADIGPKPPDTSGIDDRFYVPYIFTG